MAKQINTAKEFQRAFKRAFKELLSKQNMRILGDDIARGIKLRSQLGKRVKIDKGAVEKLKKLSDGYKKARRRARRNSQLSKDTQPSKSNLTFTGEMFRDIGAKSKFAFVRILFKTKDAKQKAEWVAEGGREFMHLSKAELKKITRKLDKKARKVLKKHLD